MKKNPIFIYVCSLLLLTSCAQMKWEKSGITQQEFAKDKFECERQATIVIPPKPYTPPQPQMVGNQYVAPHWTSNLAAAIDSSGGSYVNNNLLEGCMASKGYIKTRVKK